MVTETEVKSIVSEVLTQRFADADLLRSDVELARDFDGEQIVRITALFDKKAATAVALFAASDEIRARLRKIGDERFVFIRQDIRDDQNAQFGDENNYEGPQ